MCSVDTFKKATDHRCSKKRFLLHVVIVINVVRPRLPYTSYVSLILRHADADADADADANTASPMQWFAVVKTAVDIKIHYLRL